MNHNLSKNLILILILLSTACGSQNVLQKATTPEQKWYATLETFQIFQVESLVLMKDPEIPDRIKNVIAEISNHGTSIAEEVEAIRSVNGKVDLEARITQMQVVLTEFQKILQENLKND